MYVQQLALAGFRNYGTADIQPAPSGITLLQGPNGAGKTNVLEAVAYMATLKSFRGSPKESMVMHGRQQAVLRGHVNREARQSLVEIELNVGARDKVRLNRQPLRKHEELAGALLVTVFSPDDIEVVKGPPQLRRQYLDDLLASLHAKDAALQLDLERALRQRNALLRSANGVLRGAMGTTLDVWDAKLAQLGEALAQARQQLACNLQPEVDKAYRLLSSAEPDASSTSGHVLSLRYERSWAGPLAEALLAARGEDLRRGATTTGPQRDDLHVYVGTMMARVEASQGEQRSAALALRLGGHNLVAQRQGTNPVLLLDDVFSELDPVRSAALAGCLPQGQTLLTTAGPVPAQLDVAAYVAVDAGGLTVAQVPQRGPA